MSGVQTCLCLAGAVVLLAGVRIGMPAMVQIRRRRHWTLDRALPPSAPGHHVSVPVHPLRRNRSQSDEPESPLARIAVGLLAAVVAIPLLTAALGVWTPPGLPPS